MKGLNKKGFTLVELLAVIVILSVVMLIAVTAVGPLMTRARKSALATEGIGMVNAAKSAYQAEQLTGVFGPTSSVCFDLQWLCKHNYFEKGCDGSSDGDKYSGSVLAYYNSGKVQYKFWISNGIYSFGTESTETTVANGFAKGIDPSKFDADSAGKDGTTASVKCGMKVASNKISGITYCSNAGNGCLK